MALRLWKGVAMMNFHQSSEGFDLQFLLFSLVRLLEGYWQRLFAVSRRIYHPGFDYYWHEV